MLLCISAEHHSHRKPIKNYPNEPISMSDDKEFDIFIHHVLIGELYYDLSYDSAKEDKTAVVVCQLYDENTNYPDLTSVIIPPYVTYDGETYRVVSVESYAFANCNYLTSVVFPDTVTQIEAYAFWFCHALNAIVIPNSVIQIGNSAFAFCESLTAIDIPDSVTRIGDRAFEDSYISAITFPDSITELGNSVFHDTLNPIYNKHIFAKLPPSYRGKYIIPDGIKIIAGSAFHHCANVPFSVVLPQTISHIGDETFYNCQSLTSLTCKAIVPPTLGTDVFRFVDTTIPVYVPAESVELYKAAPQWKKFRNIQPISKTSLKIDCQITMQPKLAEFKE